MEEPMHGSALPKTKSVRSLLAAVVLLVIALAVGVRAAPADAPFRAFESTSLWNVPAAQKGEITSDNPYAGEFTSYSSTMEVSGIPPDIKYAKPTFTAKPGDPCRTVEVRHPDWAFGNVEYHGECVPVPAGTVAAAGTDGHLLIISADEKRAWVFWRCKMGDDGGAPCTEANVLAGHYETANMAVWDLTGPGLATCCNNATGRGSGTPLVTTTLTAEESIAGFQHALGLTVPRVSRDYIYPPAVKSDGSCGSCGIKYGMLFVLRSDYQLPATASDGVRNLAAALKTYGAYIVDQGSSFNLDADSTNADLWKAAGLSTDSL